VSASSPFRPCLAFQLCNLVLVPSVGVAAVQPTKAASHQSPRTLVRIAVDTPAGRTYLDARQQARETFGRLSTIRYFDPGEANSWRNIKYNVGRISNEMMMGRFWRDYHPEDENVAVMARDRYNNGGRWNRYWSGEIIFGSAIRLSHRLGKPFGVAETGRLLVGSDNGGRRAIWLEELARHLGQHQARSVTYFNFNVKGDDRLREYPSQRAWRQAVVSSHSSSG